MINTTAPRAFTLIYPVSCCLLAKSLLFYSYHLAQSCKVAARKEQDGNKESPFNQLEKARFDPTNSIFLSNVLGNESLIFEPNVHYRETLL